MTKVGKVAVPTQKAAFPRLNVFSKLTSLDGSLNMIFQLKVVFHRMLMIFVILVVMVFVSLPCRILERFASSGT